MVKHARVHRRANVNKITKNLSMISNLELNYSKTTIGNCYGPHVIKTLKKPVNVQEIGNYYLINYQLEFPLLNFNWFYSLVLGIYPLKYKNWKGAFSAHFTFFIIGNVKMPFKQENNYAMCMEKIYWQNANAKTGLQNFDPAILISKIHHVLEGQLKLMKAW